MSVRAPDISADPATVRTTSDSQTLSLGGQAFIRVNPGSEAFVYLATEGPVVRLMKGSAHVHFLGAAAPLRLSTPKALVRTAQAVFDVVEQPDLTTVHVCTGEVTMALAKLNTAGGSAQPDPSGLYRIPAQQQGRVTQWNQLLFGSNPRIRCDDKPLVVLDD